MKLPFTKEQFLEVFKEYNQFVFPVQVLFYLLAAVIIWLSVKKYKNSNRAIVLILSFFFLWTGIVYHILYFATINKVAYFFGAAFVLHSILLLYYGFIKPRIGFKLQFDVYGITGMFLVLYGLVVYPVIGYFNAHAYPYSPTFGVPCPTLIFTFGIYLWTDHKLPKLLLIIPFLWSIVGFSAVSLLGMMEDMGLIIAALITVIMIFVRDKKRKDTPV